MIQKIESEKQKADFSPNVYKVNFLLGLGGCYEVRKPSDERKCSKK